MVKIQLRLTQNSASLTQVTYLVCEWKDLERLGACSCSALPTLFVLIPKRAGYPVIDANSSRSGADQPDQDDDIHSFGQIEEIVEPIEKRESFRNRRQLDRRDRDDHLDDESSTTQAREHSDNEQTAADEFNRGDEIGHEMRKRYPCAGEGFIHLASAAGYEELVASRNGEKHSERDAGEQDRKLLPRTVSEQQ